MSTSVMLRFMLLRILKWLSEQERTRMIRRLLALITDITLSLVLLGACCTGTAQLSAHPIEYHRQTLQPAQLERVLLSLEKCTARITAANSQIRLEFADDAMGIAVALWSIEDALRSDSDNPKALDQLLVAAGYSPVDTAVLEWELEAQRVLEAYETQRRNLSLDALQARAAELEARSSSMPAAELLRLEQAMLRDYGLLRTTALDIPVIEPYSQRLDAIFARLGLQVRR
jgi:hypothetical protein